MARWRSRIRENAFEQAASSNAVAPAPAAAQPGDGRSCSAGPTWTICSAWPRRVGSPRVPFPACSDSFGNAIKADASSGNLGMGTLTKAANAEQARETAEGANIRDSRKEFDSDVDCGGQVDGQRRRYALRGGAIKEAWGIGSGIDSIIQNPLGFQKAQGESASKEALRWSRTSTSTRRQGLARRGGSRRRGKRALRGLQQGQGQRVGRQRRQRKPITDDVKSGNYAGAFGPLGTQVEWRSSAWSRKAGSARSAPRRRLRRRVEPP